MIERSRRAGKFEMIVVDEMILRGAYSERMFFKKKIADDTLQYHVSFSMSCKKNRGKEGAESGRADRRDGRQAGLEVWGWALAVLSAPAGVQMAISERHDSRWRLALTPSFSLARPQDLERAVPLPGNRQAIASPDDAILSIRAGI